LVTIVRILKARRRILPIETPGLFGLVAVYLQQLLYFMPPHSNGVAKIVSDVQWLVERHIKNHLQAGLYDAEKRQSSPFYQRSEL
jgi:hypothetical protein